MLHVCLHRQHDRNVRRCLERCGIPSQYVCISTAFPNNRQGCCLRILKLTLRITIHRYVSPLRSSSHEFETAVTCNTLELLITQSPPPAVTCSILGHSILLSALFSSTLEFTVPSVRRTRNNKTFLIAPMQLLTEQINGQLER